MQAQIRTYTELEKLPEACRISESDDLDGYHQAFEQEV